LRLTVGDRSLAQGGAELKRRDSTQTTIEAIEEVIPRLKREIAALEEEVREKVVRVEFEG
jgi:hypothetical protein